MGSIAGGIESYVKSIYDPRRPAASIAAFIAPGLLWKLRFHWLMILYTVAEALGFDWKSFWSTVGRGIASLVKPFLGLNGRVRKKIPGDVATSHIRDVVNNAFSNNFSGEVDTGALLNIVKKHKFDSDINEALDIKSVALKLQNNPIIKEAIGIPSVFKMKLVRFFTKIIVWLVITSLVSLGLVSAAGAASGAIKHFTDSEDGEESAENNEGDQPIYKLTVSPNAPQDMFTVHPNNMSNVWLERGDINNINNILVGWVKSIYPTLNIENIQSSSAFNSVLNKFRTRNRLASGLGVISIPRPYERKADVVSAIVNEFLRQSPQ
jgi:hypothetical protein